MVLIIDCVFFVLFFVKLGDLETAQNYFKRVESKATGDPKSLSSVVMNK